MKTFIPVVQLLEPWENPSPCTEQFGGIPWGFPVGRWPICRECQTPMPLLARLSHHPLRLNLGKEGRVLYLFICNSMKICDTSEPDEGANAVIILDREEMTMEAPQPPDHPEYRELPPLAVRDWKEVELDIPETLRPSFFDEALWMSDEWSEDLIEKLYHGTCLGGVPAWYQAPAPFPAYDYAGQIDSWMDLPAPITHSRLIEVRNGDFRYKQIVVDEKRMYDVDDSVDHPSVLIYSFGDQGTGYLFVKPDPDHPEGRFLWQCS